MLTNIPNGYAEMIKTFGNPSLPKFEEMHIVSFPLPYTLFYDGNPVNKSRCHKLVVDNFIQAFKNVMAAGLTEELKEFNGIYNHRPIRGFQKLSTHAFGIAIDLEASKYRLGSSKRMPNNIIECFTKVGFFYGGDFKLRKDGMHFQLALNY